MFSVMYCMPEICDTFYIVTMMYVQHAKCA